MSKESDKIHYDVKLLEQALTSFTNSFSTNLKKLENTVDKLATSFKAAATKDDLKEAIQTFGSLQEVKIAILEKHIVEVEAKSEATARLVGKYSNMLMVWAVSFIFGGVIAIIVLLLKNAFLD